MTSVTCVCAWLFAVLMVPLMLFIWALDTKKPELTDIEVTAGVGKRLLEYMELAQLLLGGGLWTSFLDQRDCFF